MRLLLCNLKWAREGIYDNIYAKKWSPLAPLPIPLIIHFQIQRLRTVYVQEYRNQLWNKRKILPCLCSEFIQFLCFSTAFFLQFMPLSAIGSINVFWFRWWGMMSTVGLSRSLLLVLLLVGVLSTAVGETEQEPNREVAQPSEIPVS